MSTAYRTFVLTVWRGQGEAGDPVLHMRVRDPHSGQQRGFSEPERMLAFLQQSLDDGQAGAAFFSTDSENAGSGQ
ncbi:MAG: hypothetical protein R2844_03175 [Caldilineales bacterium]